MKGLLIFAVLSFAAMTTGCVSRAISEGTEKALGPTGYVLPMDPKWPAEDHAFLAAYKNFELAAPIQSEFPDLSQRFIEYFPGKLKEQLVGRGLSVGNPGKTLLIKVNVLAYQGVSSYHKALGPTEEVVARVELVDKDGGNVVGKAICIGRTYQSVGLGPKWKAWGLSRAIVNSWIDKYYPKEGRNEAEEEAPPEDKQDY